MALLCGLLSGPAGYAVAVVAANIHWVDGPVQDIIPFSLIVLSLGAAFAFSTHVRSKLPEHSPARHKTLATIGVIATFGWGCVLVALFVFG